MSPGANATAASVVDVHPVRRRLGKFVSVDCGEGPRDDRPCVRVGGSFAGEVPGVEFLESGVDVVGVEQDDADDPVVGVDLDDGERPRCGTPRAPSAPDDRLRVRTRRSPAGRNDGRRHGLRTRCRRSPASSRSRHPDHVGRRRSRPDGDRRAEKSSASISRPCASQSRTAKYVQKRSYDSACRVFQLRRRTAEFIEPRERGVEVCLVEDFAAVDQVAVDRQQV